MAGELRSAKIILKNVLQDDPGDGNARLLLAKIYLDSGDARAAEQEILRAISSGIPRDYVLVPLAEALLAQGQPKRMLTEIRVSDAADGQAEATLLAIRGDSYLAIDDAEQAAAQFELALRKKPKLERALLGQAKVALTKSGLAAAKPILLSALEAHPASVPALELLGEIAYEEMKYPEAEDAYTRALLRARSKWMLHYKRALARVANGDTDGAAEDVDAALKIRSDFPGLFYAQGLVHYARGELERAYQYFERYLQLVPGSNNAVYYAGITSFRLQHYEQAEFYLTRFLNARPRSERAVRYLAAALVKRGDFSGAEELTKPFVKRKDVAPDLLATYGEALAGQGRLDESGAILARLVAAHPDNVDVRLSYAQALYLAGKYQQARREISAVVKAQPGHIPARLLDVSSYIALGDQQGAVEAARVLAAEQPDQPDAHNALGVALDAAGDKDGAMAAYRRALQVRPGHWDAARNLAQMALTRGDEEAARDLLLQVLEQNPKNTGAILALTQLDVATGRREEAIDRLEKAVRDHPRDVLLRANLARGLVKAGEPEKAVLVFSDTPSDQVNRPELLVARGEAELASSQAYTAVSTFERLLEVDPDTTAHRYRLAWAMASARNETGMRKALFDAIRLNPKDPLLGPTLAQIYKAMPDARSREELVAELSRTVPRNPQVSYLRGSVALANGEYAKALALGKRLRKSEPGNRSFMELTARAQRGVRDTAGAVRTLDEWLKVNPEDAHGHLMAGQLQELEGDKAKAEAAYSRAIELDPDLAAGLNNLALLVRGSDPERAYDYAQRAHRLLPDSLEMADTLGLILLDRGESEEAEELLREIWVIHPTDPTASFHYAQALAAVGKKSEALRILSKVAAKRFPERAEAQTLLQSLGTP